jgi:hypothetical protein
MQVVIGALVAASLALCRAGAGSPDQGPRFIALDQFGAFDRSSREGVSILTSPWLIPDRPWNELVVSWNANCPPGWHLVIEARAAGPIDPTPFYVMGVWSTNADRRVRRSVRRQKDAWGEVKTDTLVCSRLMERVQVRLTLETDPPPEAAGGPSGSPSPTLPPGQPAWEKTLKFVGLCTINNASPALSLPPNQEAWGRCLEVPRRPQTDYREGAAWCSPASLSMVLAYWAARLGRPELDMPVPEVARKVEDPEWPGTGNWAFNTAYAGQFDGLRACVARLADVSEIEDWVVAGVPVVASVSFDLLNGQNSDADTGHLVVVVGFTPAGEVLVNDPWPDPKGGNSVRRRFARETFRRAWGRSRQAVYLIRPLSMPPPPSPQGRWESGR